MRTSILQKCLLGAFLLSGTQNFAQSNKGFAITGETKGSLAWMTVREIDLSTGAETRKIYSPTDKPALIDALSGARLQAFDMSIPLKDQVSIINRNGIMNTTVTYTNGKQSEVVTAPTESLVAASAYDLKTNRLFFTPMRGNELRYFDLNSGTNAVYYVRNVALKPYTESNDEANVITRMCFGSDGYGYALTNDANHLIRFSPAGKISITDLGSVKDGQNNNNMSLRTMCTSWGGDMVADATGNLYSISMRGNIFKINPQTMVGDFAGTVTGLPQDFTVNGAAVDAEGKIIVTSAAKTDFYYSIDITTLKASVLPKQEDQVFNASDLASCNYVNQAQTNSKTATLVTVKGNMSVSIYPNPVMNKTVNISFDAYASGNRTVQLADVTGKTILSKVVKINGKTTSQIILPASATSGIYVIKVIDASGKQEYSGKVVVY